MMSTSAFLQHFIAQHGPRPHPYGRDAELLIAISDGQRAEQTLREVELWEARMGAALYAWQANATHDGRRIRRTVDGIVGNSGGDE